MDRRADLAEELRPVFEQLSTTTDQSAEVVARAEREAAERRVIDADRARAVTAAAQQRVAAERAAAAQRTRERGQAQSGRIMAAAAQEAERIRTGGDVLIPTLVGTIVAAVDNLIVANSGGQQRAAGES